MSVSMNTANGMHNIIGGWVDEHFDDLTIRLGESGAEVGFYGDDIENAIKLAVLACILAQATTSEYHDK